MLPDFFESGKRSGRFWFLFCMTVVRMYLKKEYGGQAGAYAPMRLPFRKKYFSEKMIFSPEENFYEKSLLYYFVIII